MDMDWKCQLIRSFRVIILEYDLGFFVLNFVDRHTVQNRKTSEIMNGLKCSIFWVVLVHAKPEGKKKPTVYSVHADNGSHGNNECLWLRKMRSRCRRVEKWAQHCLFHYRLCLIFRCTCHFTLHSSSLFSANGGRGADKLSKNFLRKSLAQRMQFSVQIVILMKLNFNQNISAETRVQCLCKRVNPCESVGMRDDGGATVAANHTAADSRCRRPEQMRFSCIEFSCWSLTWKLDFIILLNTLQSYILLTKPKLYILNCHFTLEIFARRNFRSILAKSQTFSAIPCHIGIGRLTILPNVKESIALHTVDIGQCILIPP